MKNDFGSCAEIDAMHAAVCRFQETTLKELRSLVDELDIRATRIQGLHREWDRDFRQSWEALEEAYAVMVDRGLATPDETLLQVVTSALGKLKSLLERTRGEN